MITGVEPRWACPAILKRSGYCAMTPGVTRTGCWLRRVSRCLRDPVVYLADFAHLVLLPLAVGVPEEDVAGTMAGRPSPPASR